MEFSDRWVDVVYLVGIHRDHVHGRNEFLGDVVHSLDDVSVSFFSSVTRTAFDYSQLGGLAMDEVVLVHKRVELEVLDRLRAHIVLMEKCPKFFVIFRTLHFARHVGKFL